MVSTVVIFLITLLILVVSHELGHFLAAKKFGVKILEFGFGLPPRVWGRRMGETLVSINLLPIGGFVRLFGEDETAKKVLENKRSFAAKPVLQRMVIVAAGVGINLALAVVLFWVVLIAKGFEENIPLLTPFRFAGVNQANELFVLIAGVSPDSPAAAAGLKQGDRVVAINQTKVESSDQLVNLTRNHIGEKVTLTLVDFGEKRREVEITPRANPPEGQGPLGIELSSMTIAHLSYATNPQKLFSGFTHSYNLTTYSFSILGTLISSSIQQKNLGPVSHSVSGPVGITQIAGTILKTESPLIPYLNFMALLSLNLGVINILPFPAMDGGRLFFLLIEAIFRRRVKAGVEKWVHTVGMALLIALIILITFSDIKKFF